MRLSYLSWAFAIIFVMAIMYEPEAEAKAVAEAEPIAIAEAEALAKAIAEADPIALSDAISKKFRLPKIRVPKKVKKGILDALKNVVQGAAEEAGAQAVEKVLQGA